jgi:hypothetical protein
MLLSFGISGSSRKAMWLNAKAGWQLIWQIAIRTTRMIGYILG